MTSGNTEQNSLAADVTVPAPLVLGKLRDHFRRAYLLNDDQVETMLVSSSRSLRHAIAGAHELLEGTEEKNVFSLLFHGLKGLLLNMGEAEWAAYTMELENRLMEGEQLDYRAAIKVIEEGLSQILSYVGGTAPQDVSSENGS